MFRRRGPDNTTQQVKLFLEKGHPFLAWTLAWRNPVYAFCTLLAGELARQWLS